MSSEQAEKQMETSENDVDAKTEIEPPTAPNAEITESQKDHAKSNEETVPENEASEQLQKPAVTTECEGKTVESESNISEPEVKPVESTEPDTDIPVVEAKEKTKTEEPQEEKPEESIEKIEEPTPPVVIETTPVAEVNEVEQSEQKPDDIVVAPSDSQTETAVEKSADSLPEAESPAAAVSEEKGEDVEETPAEQKEDEGTSEEKQNGAAEGAVGGVEVEADPKNFNGKYSHVKSENVESFFKAVGLPWMFRKIATRFSPTTDIVQDGDKFQIKFVAGFKTKEWKFTVGEDFEDKPMGWSNDTMIVHSAWEDNKLVMNSEPKSEKAKAKPMKITRHMNGEELTMVLEVENVVCTRVFKRKK